MANLQVKQKKLTNFKVVGLKDKSNREYFAIFDNDGKQGENAYFCWSDTLKDRWGELIRNSQNWTEIEIEYEEREKGNKILDILSPTFTNVF